MQDQHENGAAMAVDIKYIKENISEIKNTLKEMRDNFIRKEEFGKFVDHYDGLHQGHTSDINTLQLEMNTLETSWKTWGIIAGIILGVVEPIIVTLIITKVL